MARKPNYRFDRMEKDRVKAAKKAERLKAKQDRSANRQATDGPDAAQAAGTPDAVDEASDATEGIDVGGAVPGSRTSDA